MAVSDLLITERLELNPTNFPKIAGVCEKGIMDTSFDNKYDENELSCVGNQFQIQIWIWN